MVLAQAGKAIKKFLRPRLICRQAGGKDSVLIDIKARIKSTIEISLTEKSDSVQKDEAAGTEVHSGGIFHNTS